jgi:hypothetical protein
MTYTTVTTLTTAANRRTFVDDLERAVTQLAGVFPVARSWRKKNGAVSDKTGSAYCHLAFTIPGKLSVMLYAGGHSVPLLHWYGAASRLRHVPGAWHTVNAFHGAKATSHPFCPNDAIACLVAGLTAAADGSAFAPIAN